LRDAERIYINDFHPDNTLGKALVGITNFSF